MTNICNKISIYDVNVQIIYNMCVKPENFICRRLLSNESYLPKMFNYFEALHFAAIRYSVLSRSRAQILDILTTGKSNHILLY